jgi:hypothetical protein
MLIPLVLRHCLDLHQGEDTEKKKGRVCKTRDSCGKDEDGDVRVFKRGVEIIRTEVQNRVRK